MSRPILHTVEVDAPHGFVRTSERAFEGGGIGP